MKAVLVVRCLAPAVLACMLGTGHTQSLTLSMGATYKGTAEIRGYPSDGSCTQLYTVPAGVTMRISDFALDPFGATTSMSYQYLCTGKPNCTVARTAYLTAPAGSTLVATFQNGIKINAGDTLSACNYSGQSRSVAWTIQGILYTIP